MAMIEEVVSDVEIKSEGTNSGADDEEDYVIITGELEEHCYSKVKLKLFEQRRTRHAPDPEPELPVELLHGWRIISFLMSTNCRSFCVPFLDKPETSMREHWRTNGDGLRNTTWLLQIKQQILDKKKYETISEIVSDIRMMLECCYLTFGPHHPISKKGIKMEQVLEQKINTLPRDLREKCSIDVTRPSDIPRGRLKVEDGESMLIAIIRHEKSVKERELRFKAREEKKFEKETLTNQAEVWDKTDVTPKIPEVQAFWEVPHVAHFLFLVQHALGFPEFTMYEFERSLILPRWSLLLHSLMSCLLTTGFKSVSATISKPPLPYKEWNDKLRNKIAGWYKIYLNHGARKVFDDFGVEAEFFEILGETSPFDIANAQNDWSTFEDFSMQHRIAIIKALCDQRLAKHKIVQDYFVEGTYSSDELRQITVGHDLVGREYFYFPCLSNHDVRIYSSVKLPLSQPHDDCYQVAIKRIPRPVKPKKRKKKQKDPDQIETKSRRKSAKQAAKAFHELSDESSEEEFDEEVVVYNSDGCPHMKPGENQYKLDFAVAAENVVTLRELIAKLKHEAEEGDSEKPEGNGIDEEEEEEIDETTNDTQDNGDDKGDVSSEEVENGKEKLDDSDSRSMSVLEEDTSQDASSAHPRRSSRQHRQTQRFTVEEENDEENSNYTMPTRRSTRRGMDNGDQKVDPLVIKKVPETPRERLTLKIVLNKSKEDKKQPSNKRLISKLEAILEQFLPFEQGFAQNDQRTRLKLYTEVHHANYLQEEQKQQAEEEKTKRSKRVKDPWAATSQYMDNEILYGDSAFDCLSDSDDEEKAKRPQPTRRSTRHVNGPDRDYDDDGEWKCRDGERF